MIDELAEKAVRKASEGISRRSFVAKTGKLLLAAVGINLVPYLLDFNKIKEVEAYHCGDCHLCNMSGYPCSHCVNSNEDPYPDWQCPSGSCMGGYWTGCCYVPPLCGAGQKKIVYYTDCFGGNAACYGSCGNCSGCTLYYDGCPTSMPYKCTAITISGTTC